MDTITIQIDIPRDVALQNLQPNYGRTTYRPSAEELQTLTPEQLQTLTVLLRSAYPTLDAAAAPVTWQVVITALDAYAAKQKAAQADAIEAAQATQRREAQNAEETERDAVFLTQWMDDESATLTDLPEWAYNYNTIQSRANWALGAERTHALQARITVLQARRAQAAAAATVAKLTPVLTTEQMARYQAGYLPSDELRTALHRHALVQAIDNDKWLELDLPNATPYEDLGNDICSCQEATSEQFKSLQDWQQVCTGPGCSLRLCLDVGQCYVEVSTQDVLGGTQQAYFPAGD